MTQETKGLEPFNDLKRMLKVFDDSKRMAILFHLLKTKQSTVKELQEKLDLPGNTIYHHLNKLESVSLVIVQNEPIEGTNLSRKIYRFNFDFFSRKKDPEWHKIVEEDLKSAFMAEMYIAIAALMEGIHQFQKLSINQFKDYYKVKKPQCDVLFLTKTQFNQIQTLIKNFLKEFSNKDITTIFKESEGYIYSFFAYPPINK